MDQAPKEHDGSPRGDEAILAKEHVLAGAMMVEEVIGRVGVGLRLAILGCRGATDLTKLEVGNAGEVGVEQGPERLVNKQTRTAGLGEDEQVFGS